MRDPRSGGDDRRRGGTRDRSRPVNEPVGPELPADVTGLELDPDVRSQLGTLSKATADRVARHLVMAGQLVDEEPEEALEHALAARSEGSRLGVVREAVAYTAYAAGKYEQALAEFRAARRMTGSAEYFPAMADCERGLRRPERALDLIATVDRSELEPVARVELLIVEAGARRDLGQPAAALALLDVPALHGRASATAVTRVRYAYADTLEELGRRDEAAQWFARVVEVDADAQTDAEERLARLGEG